MGLDFVELIVAVEKGFQIRIENEEAGGVSTVGDLHKLVVSKLEGKEVGVWKILARIILSQTGVESEQITADARFVEDLGVD